jgi:hypothetical protein
MEQELLAAFAEFNDALRELKKEVRALRMETFETHRKMSQAMNASHIPSAMRMLDNNFEIRELMERGGGAYKGTKQGYA